MRETIVTMDVNVTSLPVVLDTICQWSDERMGRYVCVSNVHMSLECFDSHFFRRIVNQADLIIPDGKPLSVSQKLLGHTDATQVRGEDIMNALCAISGEKNINIGFYGGSSEAILDSVKSNLVTQNPGIKITYAFSPPFRPLSDAEDSEVISQISAAEVNVLFVGIGCPKQEIWMADHKGRLNCVMLGVGAAFDFIASPKRHAPRWVQNNGLEWFFRLCCEPKRLWKRYLLHNPRFVFYFFKQFLKHRVARANRLKGN